MVKVLLVFLMLFSSLFSIAQTDFADIDNKTLKGPIKSMRSTLYQMKIDNDGNATRTRVVLPPGSFLRAYDKNGNLTNRKQFQSRTGQLVSEESYVYDNANRMLKSTSSNWLSDGSYSYVYREAGRVRETKDSGGKTRAIETFDANGNLIEEASYYEDKLLRIQTYTYDEQKRLLAVSWKELNDSFYASSYTYTYSDSEKAMVISKKFSDGDEMTEKHVEIKFDQYGNWTERLQYEYGEPKLVEERIIEYYK